MQNLFLWDIFWFLGLFFFYLLGLGHWPQKLINLVNHRHLLIEETCPELLCSACQWDASSVPQDVGFQSLNPFSMCLSISLQCYNFILSYCKVFTHMYTHTDKNTVTHVIQYHTMILQSSWIVMTTGSSSELSKLLLSFPAWARGHPLDPWVGNLKNWRRTCSVPRLHIEFYSWDLFQKYMNIYIYI